MLMNDYCSTRIVVIMYMSQGLSCRLNGRVPAFYMNYIEGSFQMSFLYAILNDFETQ